MTTRRSLLATATLAALPIPLLAQRSTRVSVWRDPNCGCCTGWVTHLRAEGFGVEDVVVRAVGPVRQRLGTPADLLSCHAGEVDGFVLEGHVPAAAIRRLLAERPPGVRGLAVPEMPIGSPGAGRTGRRLRRHRLRLGSAPALHAVPRTASRLRPAPPRATRAGP